MEHYVKIVEQFFAQNIVPYSWNILSALVLFFVGKWVVAQLCKLLERRLYRKIEATVARFIARMAYFALLIFLAIAALGQLGVETTSLVAIFGAAGLAVGFALKDSLSNFAAGIMLVVFRPFKEGDFVEAGGAMGTVTDIRIFATRLTSAENELIIVPNDSIMANNITNYTTLGTLRADMEFRVDYSSDLKAVRKVFEELLKDDDRVLAEPEPAVLVHELGESAIHFEIRPWTNWADCWAFQWDYKERVKERFEQEGIIIPAPRLDVNVDRSTQ